MTLQEFLNKNKNIYNLTTEVAISKRLSDENGKPFLFKIKGISSSVYELIRRQNTKIDDSGQIKFNNSGFNFDLILKATVYPNFKDAESIKEAGAADPRGYIESVLLPGEIAKLANKISEFNGFKDDINELIEEAKN